MGSSRIGVYMEPSNLDYARAPHTRGVPPYHTLLIHIHGGRAGKIESSLMLAGQVCWA
jgi:hypothetical protein